MAAKHIIIPVGITVAGVLVWMALAERISPEDYHTEPMEALLDAGLYGGPGALAGLPTLEPLLYINEPVKDSGFFLNVLIPVPKGTSVGSPVFATPAAGTLRVTYSAQSNDPSGPADGLFHQTLLRVAADVTTVIVGCVMARGGTGTSTVGTSDADHEDPISGGPATPYMSAMTADGLMLYTGDADCDASVTVSGSLNKTAMHAEPVFQRFDPKASSFTLFTAGGRTVDGVW